MDFFLEKASENVKQEISEYCKKEKHRPFTLNKEYQNRKEANLTANALLRNQNSSTGLPFTTSGHFRLQDGATRMVHNYPATEENLITVLYAYGIQLPSLTQLARLHADEYDAELDVIAHVTAYFDIASTRVVDNIPQLFESSFASRFQQDLEENLAKRLKIMDGGEARCRMYVRDEPLIQSRRENLMRDKKILRAALEKIDMFYQS